MICICAATEVLSIKIWEILKVDYLRKYGSVGKAWGVSVMQQCNDGDGASELITSLIRNKRGCNRRMQQIFEDKYWKYFES